MEAHRVHAVIPEDHRLILDVPKSIRSGPVEVIFLVPPEPRRAAAPPAPSKESLARWNTVMAKLAADRRPFHTLTLAEKQERISLVRGVGKGLLPSSEEIIRSKREEVELEERKFGR